MPFYAASNLTQQAVHACEPWNFKFDADPGLQVRKDKESRQDFYRNVGTVWNFYTGIEGANPNQRASKDNPPSKMSGLPGDYDVKIPGERVAEAIASMPIKPQWVERSLGGNVRLVWQFERPVAVDNYDFCVFFLEQCREWLSLDMLPGLDGPALTDPTRLFCNGGEWISTGFPPVPEAKLQAFLVKCGKAFRFKSSDIEIPLTVVEAQIREKYKATFSWPGPFEEGTQGPSFWVEGSVSPLSAIVKKEGMFTFSAHAGKPFYSWGELLGKEFVQQFADDVIAKATTEVYWDGHRFWRKLENRYVSCDSTELTNFFKVECALSTKPGKDGISMIDLALNHVFNNGRVDGAAPFIFRPPGILEYMGRKKLNTYLCKPIQPADELTPWGEEGKFPFLSKLLDALFEPAHQRDHFLAWWKHFYSAAINQTPMPGQSIFLMGEAGTGKTLVSRHIVGKSVGGFSDASAYLARGATFNSELVEMPLWCVDDETMAESQYAQQNFSAMLKKTTANQEIAHNKKFEVATMTEWQGRIIVTTNVDYISSKALGPMDNTSLDKISIFRCGSATRGMFTSRAETAAAIDRELPYLLRHLLNWSPPAHIARDSRYGFAAFHEKTLLDQAHQGSKAAPFKELLLEALDQWFSLNPGQTEFRGSVTQIVRLIVMNPANDIVLRSLRLEQTARYLEMIQREGILKCAVENGPDKTRVWVFFKREDTAPGEAPLPPQTDKL